MFIDSINKMEEIVENRTNLSWESNFDIIEDLGENANAMLKKNARFIQGAWHKVNVIKLTERGWKIPQQWVNNS